MDSFDPATGEVVPLKPEMPVEIAKAIIAVAKEVKRLGADSNNEHARYAYVSVDKFYEQIGKLMAEAGLAVIVDETGSDVKEGKSGNPWLFMRYQLMFMHESGATSPPMGRSCALPISGPQAFGAAQSYVEKQFLRQVFKVPTGEKDADDTAPQDGAAPAGAPRQQHQRQQAAPPDDAVKAEARQRWRGMRDEIDNSPTVADLNMLTDPVKCPAWAAMVEHVKRAEGANAEGVVGQLVERAERRKALLLADAPQTEEYQ